MTIRNDFWYHSTFPRRQRPESPTTTPAALNPPPVSTVGMEPLPNTLEIYQVFYKSQLLGYIILWLYIYIYATVVIIYSWNNLEYTALGLCHNRWIHCPTLGTNPKMLVLTSGNHAEAWNRQPSSTDCFTTIAIGSGWLTSISSGWVSHKIVLEPCSFRYSEVSFEVVKHIWTAENPNEDSQKVSQRLCCYFLTSTANGHGQIWQLISSWASSSASWSSDPRLMNCNMSLKTISLGF